MPDIDPTQPLEPWTGYADMEPAARLAQFQQKYDAAREQSDHAYAVALSAAVGNFEQLRQAASAMTHDDDARAKARDLHDDAGSWKPN